MKTLNADGSIDAVWERMLEINPDVNVEIHKCFFLPENADDFPFSEYDYIVDAIDSVKGKIELAVQADKTNTPIISSMGAGNKIHPEMFEIADIYKTSVCPLARVMRYELRKRGVKKLKVVYSKEEPITPLASEEECHSRRSIPGSTAFSPSVAGLIIASEIINEVSNFD